MQTSGIDSSFITVSVLLATAPFGAISSISIAIYPRSCRYRVFENVVRKVVRFIDIYVEEACLSLASRLWLGNFRP